MADGHCAACGVLLDTFSSDAPASFHVDHVLPKSLGGPDHISNYQPLCRTCNTRKGSRTEADYRSEALRRKYIPQRQRVMDEIDRERAAARQRADSALPGPAQQSATQAPLPQPTFVPPKVNPAKPRVGRAIGIGALVMLCGCIGITAVVDPPDDSAEQSSSSANSTEPVSEPKSAAEIRQERREEERAERAAERAIERAETQREVDDILRRMEPVEECGLLSDVTDDLDRDDYETKSVVLRNLGTGTEGVINHDNWVLIGTLEDGGTTIFVVDRVCQ